jgi:zeaxanthin glucosyltransferase
MTALARKMQSRGNDVVVISVPEAESAVRAANLRFVPFCEKEYPAGSVAQRWSSVSKLHGADALSHSTRQLLHGLCEAAFEHLPATVAENGIEALAIDSIYFFVGLVPMHLGIPFVTVWGALQLDFSGTTPPCRFSWPHETTPEAVARNVEGLKMMGESLAPLLELAKSYAGKAGLAVDWSDRNATASKLAVITQAPKEFDFPNIPWPAEFHYTGPFHEDAGRKEIPFPWEKLTGKPLVYASMGTVLNGSEYVYRTILDAVRAHPEIQLALSVGHNVDIDDLGPIPANAVVVNSAPQLELLKRASLCITHAGLNTTLEALAQGVPLIAIPVGYDQPGVAARIKYHGLGEFVEMDELTVARLSELIHRVETNQSYHDNARSMQKVIAETHGLDLAADVMEKALGLSQTVDTEGAALFHA